MALPTSFGLFEVRAFERPSGHVYVALVLGDVDGTDGVLTRLHSECLTGDVLGSLRCDCGVQLRLALRAIAAAGRGVLVYATGQEGRGIGLINKLRSYVEQDRGADTVEASLRLGLPIDARDYGDTAAVLAGLGVRSVRLMTNNPDKVAGLRRAGIDVSEVEPLATTPHSRNRDYLATKERRLGHVRPAGPELGPSPDLEVAATDSPISPAVDVGELLAEVRPRPGRPYVVLKFAQTLDGRIATATGDARWISSEAERRVSHAMRAACDAVLVGIGTVERDDPQLTVRMVAGSSPMRVVLDSTARLPASARILAPDAATTVITTERSPAERRDELRRRGVRVEVVAGGTGGVEPAAALAALARMGTASVLVEGGARVITSMLAAGVVDRLVVGVAPIIIGSGTEAVGQLGVTRVTDGIRLVDRCMHVVGDDVVVAGDVVR